MLSTRSLRVTGPQVAMVRTPTPRWTRCGRGPRHAAPWTRTDVASRVIR